MIIPIIIDINSIIMEKYRWLNRPCQLNVKNIQKNINRCKDTINNLQLINKQADNKILYKKLLQIQYQFVKQQRCHKKLRKYTKQCDCNLKEKQKNVYRLIWQQQHEIGKIRQRCNQKLENIDINKHKQQQILQQIQKNRQQNTNMASKQQKLENKIKQLQIIRKQKNKIITIQSKYLKQSLQQQIKLRSQLQQSNKNTKKHIQSLQNKSKLISQKNSEIQQHNNMLQEKIKEFQNKLKQKLEHRNKIIMENKSMTQNIQNSCDQNRMLANKKCIKQEKLVGLVRNNCQLKEISQNIEHAHQNRVIKQKQIKSKWDHYKIQAYIQIMHAQRILLS